MLKDKEHYRVKITVTNLNYRMNFTEWNLVVQYHPILDITQISGFNYKSIQVGKISKSIWNHPFLIKKMHVYVCVYILLTYV